MGRELRAMMSWVKSSVPQVTETVEQTQSNERVARIDVFLADLSLLTDVQDCL